MLTPNLVPIDAYIGGFSPCELEGNVGQAGQRSG
jgi:hypothetical protein